MQLIDILLSRRSVTAKDMTGPGPSDEQIDLILQAAHRVPDHGKLGPWRFVVFKNDARIQFGNKLAQLYLEDHPEASEKLIDFQRNLLVRAPVVIAVISTAEEHIKIPQWEQVLSAGAACQNILLAATALDFGAQWLTEWYSYDERVKKLLGLQPHHQVAGFVYIGHSLTPPEERVRPSLAERISFWEDSDLNSAHP